MLWAIPVGMAALGAVKGEQDRQQARNDRKMEAEIARWSPWTGMQAQRVRDNSSPLGGALQGGVGGLGIMQAFQNSGMGSQGASASSGTPLAGEAYNGDNASMQPTQEDMYQQQLNQKSPYFFMGKSQYAAS